MRSKSKNKREFISVVVPTYNRKEQLGATLNSLLRQTYSNKGYEIVVVDDGSTDSTADEVEKLRKKSKVKIKFFRQGNKGPAAARNLGVSKALGEIVAFTDDDCIVPKNWLERLAESFLRENVVGVGGDTIASEKELQKNIFARLDRWKCKYIHGGLREKEFLGNFDCPIGGGANTAYKKFVLVEMGGFNEKLRTGEELDLKRRICEGGYKLMYIPLIVVHNKEYSLKASLNEIWVKGMGFDISGNSFKIFLMVVLCSPIIVFKILLKFLKHKSKKD